MPNQDQEVSARGKFVTWSLTSNTNAEALKEALESIPGPNGTGKDFSRFAPKTHTSKSALHAALMKVFRRSTLIRPLREGKRGYSVVREETNKTSAVTGNSATLLHNTLFEVTLSDPHSKVPDFIEIEDDGLPEELENRIRVEFRHQLTVVPHSNLASSLARIVDCLHGISMRPAGGVYWLPEQCRTYWDGISSAVMKNGSGNVINGARTVIDAEMTDMVVHNLVRTCREEMERTADALEDNSELPEDEQWGQRKLKTMLDRAKHLRKRLLGYAKMMGVNLDELKEQLEELDVSINATLNDVIAAKDKKK